MTAIIVDDEPKARRILQNYLEQYCPDVKILATAADVPEAVKAIIKHKPELVFLDIEMPEQDGFALFDYFNDIDFQVIFVTASHEHAVKAFKVSALDYILKPIDIEQLIAAVKKAQSKHQTRMKEQISEFSHNLKTDKINRIALSLNDSIEFIKLNDIQYLKAEGSYTEFHLDGGKKIIASKPLGEYSFLETQPGFMKTHRSYLINLQKVDKYQKDSGGYIVMQNRGNAALSRFKKEEFLEAMSRI